MIVWLQNTWHIECKQNLARNYGSGGRVLIVANKIAGVQNVQRKHFRVQNYSFT